MIRNQKIPLAVPEIPRKGHLAVDSLPGGTREKLATRDLLQKRSCEFQGCEIMVSLLCKAKVAHSRVWNVELKRGQMKLLKIVSVERSVKEAKISDRVKIEINFNQRGYSKEPSSSTRSVLVCDDSKLTTFSIKSLDGGFFSFGNTFLRR